MASTQSTTKTPNYGRRIKWLGISAALVAALYSGGWFWLAGEGERRLDAAIAKSAESGRVGECVNRDIKGYPFRLGLFCDKVAFSDDERGIVFNAGALRSAAQVYNPKHVVVELDGPAFIETQDVPPLELNWSLLHGSVRAAQPLPKQVSVEGKDVTAATDGKTALTADYASFHMRTENSDLLLAGSTKSLVVDQLLTPGRSIPLISGEFDFTLKDGVRTFANRTANLKEGLSNATLEISSIIVRFDDGGEAHISGTLKTDEAGLVSGDIWLQIGDGEKFGSGLAKAIPEAASMIAPALASAKGKDSMIALTLTIRDGRVSSGLFPLGEIPPLK